MATILQTYQERKALLEQAAQQGTISNNDVFVYQELVYRISILQTFQMFGRNAPVSTSMPELMLHYKLANIFLYSLCNDHRFGFPTDEKGMAQRQTVHNSLVGAVQASEKQFSSFRPSTPQTYPNCINNIFHAVLPVWLQYRDSYISLR